MFYRPPEGMEDVSKYPELFAALLDDPGPNVIKIFTTVIY